MHHERQDHQFSVTNLVRDQGAEQNDNAEPGQAAARNLPEITLGEPELGSPVSKNTTANRESDSCGEDGHKARPQQPLGIGGDSVVAYVCITHSEESGVMVIGGGNTGCAAACRKSEALR